MTLEIEEADQPRWYIVFQQSVGETALFGAMKYQGAMNTWDDIQKAKAVVRQKSNNPQAQFVIIDWKRLQ